MSRVTVIGAGLAGCEAAWQLAERGIQVALHEMKPERMTPAHHSPDFARAGLLEFAALERADQCVRLAQGGAAPLGRPGRALC